MMTWLTKLRESEPVRLFVYPALVALVAILVAQSLIDSSLAGLITGVVALVLGIPATEVARAQVTPAAGVRDAVAVGATVALEEARAAVAERFGPQGTQVLQQVTAVVEEYVGKHRR